MMDRITPNDCQKLNLKFSDVRQPLVSLGAPARDIRAKWTGEKRCPKKGEWYLSGAIVEAYRAPNDLTTPYHIAKLILTETKTITREV